MLYSNHSSLCQKKIILKLWGFLPVREVQANILSNVLNVMRRELHTVITEDTEEGTAWRGLGHKNERWQCFGQELPWKKNIQSNVHHSLVFLVFLPGNNTLGLHLKSERPTHYRFLYYWLMNCIITE